MARSVWRTLARGLFIYVAVCSGLASAKENGALTSVFVTDADGKPVPNAVVWFARPAELVMSRNESDVVVVDQIDKQFVPQFSVIQVGDEVMFPNSDSVSHHVYSFSRPNSFELPLYRGSDVPRVRFTFPGIVTLGCNIHDAMLGYIVVIDSPLYAVTDVNGMAAFKRFPDVNSSVEIWSPRLDASKSIAGKRFESNRADMAVQVSARLKPQPGVQGGSLSWEEY